MAKNDYELGRKAGYEQGWSACMDSLGRRRRLAALKYTDAPEVVYDPGPPPRFAAEAKLIRRAMGTLKPLPQTVGGYLVNGVGPRKGTKK